MMKLSQPHPGSRKGLFFMKATTSSLLASANRLVHSNVDAQPVDMVSNRRAHHRFSGNALDASGNGNHGSVFGAQLTPDRCGNANSAYLFDVHAFDTHLGSTEGMAQEERSEESADYIAAANASSAVRRIGFIAQEVESAAAAAGFEFSGVHRPIDERDHYTIGYEQFVVPLVKAVQEQQEQIESIRAEQAALIEAIERRH